MKKEVITVGLAIMLGASVVPAWAMFESDRTLSEKSTVSMVDAIRTAEQAKPGKKHPVKCTANGRYPRKLYKYWRKGDA